jgi:hypothetical protein
MAPYPAGYAMPAAVQRADLVYEAAHIGGEGPAMTHSMLAIDWLALGNQTAADLECEEAMVLFFLTPFSFMRRTTPPGSARRQLRQFALPGRFRRAYEGNLVGPYLTWMECPVPPDFCQGHRPAVDFLTGGGGFLQARRDR